MLEGIKLACNSTGAKLATHAPVIFMGVGIVAIVGGTIAACKSTLKAKPIVEEAEHNLDLVEKREEIGKTLDEDENEIEYTKEDARNDKIRVFVQTGIKLAKCYLPAGIILIGGILCMVGGYKTLYKRLGAATAAYGVVDDQFRRYRKRVADRYGEDTEKEIRYGIEEKIYDEVVGEKKDGTLKTKTVKKKVIVDPYNSISKYARFFDASCIGYEKDPAFNLAYLKNKQAWCNDRLQINGHLFLNDVYKELGLPETKEGQVVGWVVGNGDNYVDFGIYNTAIEKNVDFVNGYEDVCLLDFNVDGIIWDKL